MSFMTAGSSFFSMLLLLGSAVSAAAGPTGDPAKNQDAGKRVSRLLEGTGYRYSKISDEPPAWRVRFQANSTESLTVMVLVQDNRMCLEGILGKYGNLNDATGAMRTLLKLNAGLTGVAYLIDDKDYLVARGSGLPQNIDSQQLKSALQAVSKATDDGRLAIAAYKATAPSNARGDDPGGMRPPEGATSQVEILNGKVILAYDPTKWTEDPSDGSAKHKFHHTRGDGYAMIIAERIQIPLAQLRNIALQNALKAAPDMKVVEEKSKRVNGTDVAMVRMEGTTSGMALAYLCLYYSGSSGTVQVLTYTGQNLFDEFRPEFEAFLSGFKVQP